MTRKNHKLLIINLKKIQMYSYRIPNEIYGYAVKHTLNYGNNHN